MTYEDGTGLVQDEEALGAMAAFSLGLHQA
jgi:hypothetical protein